MATVTDFLTLEQFHQRYDGEPGYEYWFGKAVEKPVPDWMLGALQLLLGNLLFRAGYFAASEASFRIDPEWEPRPDVSGLLKLKGRYPTKPIEIAIEILSEGERNIEDKCMQYARIGILQIFVFDPAPRMVYEWDHARNQLAPITELVFGNGQILHTTEIWKELDRRIPTF